MTHVGVGDVKLGSRTVELNLLNRFEVRCDGEELALPTAAQRLLAYLALQNTPQVRSRVASTLWLDTTDQRAGANLRSTLWRTKIAGLDMVQVTGGHLGLNPSVSVDVARTLAVARSLLADGPLRQDPPRPADLAGQLLPEWYDDWVLFERERLRQVCLHALEALCSRLSAAGQHSSALEAGLLAVAAEPLRESAQRVLIEAHLREGNLSEAVRQYDRYGQLIREELGVGPSPSLKALLPVGCR